MDCSLPGFSVHGILQARILEWAANLFSRGSSQPRDWTWSLPYCRQIVYCLSQQASWILSKELHKSGGLCSLYTAAAAKSLQSCPTLCDPIDGSPPGSLVPGILQARTLEWVPISFSKFISISNCFPQNLSLWVRSQRLSQNIHHILPSKIIKQSKTFKSSNIFFWVL